MQFIDLQAQRQRIAPQIDAAIRRVLTTCGFVMGPEVTGFEKALAEFAGAKHALSCANGTDALLLPLRAWEVARLDDDPDHPERGRLELTVLGGH